MIQSKGTQYVQKAYKDANVQCNIDSSPSKDASIMEETLVDSVISENDLDSSTELVTIAKVMKMMNQEP